MLKRIIFFITISLFIFANSSMAHTGLESSNPSDGEVIKEKIDQVTLFFNTKVEQTSSFELQNSDGQLIPVKSISISENQMLGNLENPLENGEYHLKWKIIGADGHPIIGEFSFSVDVPNTESIEKNEQGEPQVEEQKQVETTSEIEEEESQDKELGETGQHDKMPSYVIPSIIGLLSLIVIMCFVWLSKKKRDS